MRFLQLVVFLCELLTMYFLGLCCVFFSHSLLFIVVFVFYNVIDMAAVRESCLLLFSILTLCPERSMPPALIPCCSSGSGVSSDVMYDLV